MPWLPISHRPQRRQADCLAACAAMLLDYWQRPIAYSRLLTLLQIGPAGAPFRNLRYLETAGVSVLIEQGDLDTLQTLLARSRPPILFVATQELSYWSEATQHAVVLAGLEQGQAYLYDPAFPNAPQTPSIDELMLAWLEMDEFYALLHPR